MKLSAIKGDRVLDVIADLIDPIANIAEDEKATALFKREKLPEGMTPNKFLLERARKSAPVLVKNHKKDIISILSIIEGVDAKEYEKKLTIPKLMVDFVDLMTDEEFIGLFTSAQTENSSGAAQENTEETKA